MNEPFRIVVADDEPLLVEEITVYLRDAGHEVVATASTGRELVEQCETHQPDIVITDIKMPDMDGLEASRAICTKRAIAVVIVSAYHDDEYINRAKEHCITSYLIKPIDQGSLKTALALAMRRFQEFEALHRENDDLRKTLEGRKVIERAKGILMKRTSLDEQAAFLRLQKMAREKATTMVAIATSILDAEKAFDM